MKISKSVIVFDYAIVIILLLLVAFFSVVADYFFTMSTFLTILRQVSITGIISIGMSFVILTGGIDLSVGSIAGVSSVTAAMLLMSGFSIPLACVITVCISIGYGIFSGVLIAKLKMPPLIATLGMMTALRGIAFIITNGLPVFGFSSTYSKFAQNTFLGIPLMVLLMMVVFICAKFILDKTVLGRYVYGVGGNPEATRLSGVSVTKMTIFVYALNGFLAGIAGLVLLSRTNSGQPSAGTGYEMDAITAVVLGGISLSGGQGKLSLVLVGVLIMGVLSTGMLMCNINDYVQQLVKGLVLLSAVAFSSLSQSYHARLGNS